MTALLKQRYRSTSVPFPLHSVPGKAKSPLLQKAKHVTSGWVQQRAQTSSIWLIYGVLFVVGTALFFAVKFWFVESAKLSKSPLTAKALWSEYKQVFKNRVSFGFAMMHALNFGGVFAYVTNSPLLMMKHFGLSNQQFGYMFAGVSVGIMVGAFFNGQLSKRKVSSSVTLCLGLSLALAAVSANIYLTHSGLDSPQTFFPWLFAFTVAYGLLAPATAHGCIDPLPEIAGVVSAVMASLQILMGALGGMLVSYFFDGNSAWAMVSIMMFFVFANACCYLFVVLPAQNIENAAKLAT
jgi:MFS transporter, DHA1 family, multidrug resistance protein